MKRNDQFDNIKGIMIFFVVFAHTIERILPGTSAHPVYRFLYLLICSFNMHVFIFISGFFSRSKQGIGVFKEDYYEKAIKGCLIPYIVFNILWDLISAAPSLQSIANVLTPSWTLWFLLSLFFWKIMLVPALRIKGCVIISFLFALYIGLFSQAGHFLSISRTISFFPFFLCGYLTPAEYIEKARSCKKIYPILAAVSAIAIIVVLTLHECDSSTFLLASSYSSMNQTAIKGILLRGISFLLAFSGIFFFFAIMPEKKCFFATWGRYSITIYLGHSVVLRALVHFNLFNLNRIPTALLLNVVLSTAICFALGNKYVHGLYKTFIGKINTLLIKEI